MFQNGRWMWAVLATVAGCLLLASSVWAISGVPSCNDSAIQELKDAQQVCLETYQLEKDTCLNRDHDCVEVCRLDREDCLIGPFTDREAGIDTCNDTLATAVAACREGYADGSAQLDACIDAAQVVAFQCRDDVREATWPLIQECRLQFRTCALVCASGGAAGSAESRACLSDARSAWAVCKAASREAFQSDRDGCLNRDHDCVEQCRLDRDNCSEPFFSQRVLAFSECVDGRGMAFDACRTAFGSFSGGRMGDRGFGRSAFRQCFDNAQVEAFQCRDQARENVNPGIRSCRTEFRQCAAACPAP